MCLISGLADVTYWVTLHTGICWFCLEMEGRLNPAAPPVMTGLHAVGGVALG